MSAKIPLKDRRTAGISFKVTRLEKRAIKKLARQAGQSLSDYIREGALRQGDSQ